MEPIVFHLHGKPKSIKPNKILSFHEESVPGWCVVEILNRCHNERDLIVDESYEEVREKLQDFEWICDLGVW